MEYRKQLIDKVECFYVDAVEEFKEVELQIIADSKFTKLFRKKNYAENISHLKRCKKIALDMDVNDISLPKEDGQAREIMKCLQRCLVHFNNLCDCHIRLQMALQKKANKEELTFSAYKELFQKVQTARNSLNRALHEMDIVYTEFTCDEDDELTESWNE